MEATHSKKIVKKNTIKARFPWKLSTLLTSTLVLLICGFRQSGSLEFLELRVFDLMMRWEKIAGKPSSETKVSEPRITLVEITESDIQQWQQSTFSDRLIAKAIAQLQKNNPKAIGLDIYRDIPQPPGNKELLQELAAENVIAIEHISKDDGVPAPPNVSPDRVGFNNFLIDNDGRVRRNFMAAKLGKNNVYSFGLQLSKKYLEIDSASLKIEREYLRIDGAFFPALTADAGGYRLRDSDVFGSQVLLQYKPLDSIARQLSITEVVTGEYNPSLIENKVVLIGYTAPSKKDVFSTPNGVTKVPGVAIHAQTVNQILGVVMDGQRLFTFLPQWGEIAWIWLWSIAGVMLVWRTKHPLTLLSGFAAITIALIGICFVGFIGAIWLPIVPSIMSLIGSTGIILAHKSFYKSSVDGLTGLPNRERIIKIVQNVLDKSTGSPIAILSIEIDRLKTIEESLGREISQNLTVSAAKRIQKCTRSHDKLARIGDAQFCLFLSALDCKDTAIAIAQRIQTQLEEVFEIESKELIIATNVGIAFYEPETKEKAEDLLRNSNIAKDRASILGKNQHVVFTPRMQTESLAQWELETDLRQAIANNEFQLYYQPIIDFKSGLTSGFEALVRWISPTRGFVSPGEFIPLAEETKLIVPIGDWILRAACRQMHQWHQKFPDYPQLTISVNLSSHQFSADLVAQVEQILAETNLAPHCLKLEITESAVMDNVEEAIALLKDLKALGIKLSIDDFGTGYSSLSYLQKFCADTLKVDQSFVRQMDVSDKNIAIVDIIVTLAHKLEMDVIAEGIETETQTRLLKELNCEYGQGYLFAKPLNLEAAEEFIIEH